jgi:hypothetical protein
LGLMSRPAARIISASGVDGRSALLDIGDFSCFVDHEGGPVGYAGVFVQNAVSLTDLTFGKIAQDGERYVVLCGEFFLGRSVIGADAKYFCIGCLKFCNTSLVCQNLLGSATGECGGEEREHDDVLAPEIRELHLAAGGGVQGEVRRFITYFEVSLAGLDGLCEQADGRSHSDQRQRQQLHKTSYDLVFRGYHPVAPVCKRLTTKPPINAIACRREE